MPATLMVHVHTNLLTLLCVRGWVFMGVPPCSYMKLSITVLGPGDKLKVHDVVKEQKEQAALEESKGIDALLLMPPSIEREVHFLVATIYRAEQLPSMDDAVMGIGKAGIDAYVRINFAGNPKAVTKYARYSSHPVVPCNRDVLD